MGKKIIFVYECPYCFTLLNKSNARHHCPDNQAPQRAQEEPDSDFLLFLNRLKNSDFVFISRMRKRANSV